MEYRRLGNGMYGVPEWMNELVFKGSKKEVEQRLFRIFKLRRFG